jgi:hypothetical protein
MALNLSRLFGRKEASAPQFQGRDDALAPSEGLAGDEVLLAREEPGPGVLGARVDHPLADDIALLAERETGLPASAPRANILAGNGNHNLVPDASGEGPSTLFDAAPVGSSQFSEDATLVFHPVVEGGGPEGHDGIVGDFDGDGDVGGVDL